MTFNPWQQPGYPAPQVYPQPYYRQPVQPRPQAVVPRPQPRPVAAVPPARPAVRPVQVPPPEQLGIRLDDSPAVVVPAPGQIGIRLE